jgi:hypothetical protein
MHCIKCHRCERFALGEAAFSAINQCCGTVGRQRWLVPLHSGMPRECVRLPIRHSIPRIIHRASHYALTSPEWRWAIHSVSAHAKRGGAVCGAGRGQNHDRDGRGGQQPFLWTRLHRDRTANRSPESHAAPRPAPPGRRMPAKRRRPSSGVPRSARRCRRSRCPCTALPRRSAPATPQAASRSSGADTWRHAQRSGAVPVNRVRIGDGAVEGPDLALVPPAQFWKRARRGDVSNDAVM